MKLAPLKLDSQWTTLSEKGVSDFELSNGPKDQSAQPSREKSDRDLSKYGALVLPG